MLSPLQQTALELILNGKSVFLTGLAGTGKTTIVNEFRALRPDVPLLASTGLAATLIGGRTVHSFFGVGAPVNTAHALRNFMRNRSKVERRLASCDCIVIDEVSMLGANLFTALEQICRLVRSPLLPWGGLQVVVVGDFCQLAPVNDDWAFLTDAWQFETVFLKEVFRSRDKDFLKVLNCLRSGQIDSTTEEYLNSRVLQPPASCVRLYARNKGVDSFNAHELSSLSGAEHTFPTYYSGSNRATNMSKLPIPKELRLKIGAQVMLRANCYKGEYVNGTVGIVVDIGKSLTIETECGIIEIGKRKFEVRNGDGVCVFTGTNFPISLAWASTIHKAQGRSLDNIYTDLRNLWAPGQAYVALSRATSGGGVFLKGWEYKSIKTDTRVRDFYDKRRS